MKGRKLFGSGIILGLGLLFSSCSVFLGDDAQVVETKEIEENRVPDTLMRSFVRTAHDAKGRILWQLKAREGRVFNDVNRIYLTDFILYSFAGDGRLRSTLRARRGMMDNNSGITVGKLAVVLRAENGRVLETSEVYANNNDKIIYNDVLNKITQEDGSVMIGTHLWAHSDLEVFKLRETQGEAPGSAGAGFLSESSASVSRSSGEKASSASAQSSTARQEVSSSRSAASASTSTSTSTSAGQEIFLPEIGVDELERIRTEIAFPQSASSRSGAASRAGVASSAGASSSTGTSSSSRPPEGRGTNS